MRSVTRWLVQALVVLAIPRRRWGQQTAPPWRTLILPYIEQQALYDTIDLSKPWDDPVNQETLRELISSTSSGRSQQAQVESG